MSLVTHSGYLNNAASQEEVQNTIRKTLKTLRKALRKDSNKFDAIACQGCSGLMIAPIVAYILKKQLVVVRKPDYKLDSHASEQVEGLPHNPVRYLVLDDFYSSGHTLRQVIYGIYRNNPAAEFVGRYSYKWDSLEFDGDEIEYHGNISKWIDQHLATEAENQQSKVVRIMRNFSTEERKDCFAKVDGW